MQKHKRLEGFGPEVLGHERDLIQAFVVKERKERLLGLLEGPNRRKLHSLLHHFKYLDRRFALAPGVGGPAEIAALLHARGAPSNCRVITSLRGLDRRLMPLEEALNQVVGGGAGSLISCIPGRLGYFEGEEPGHRYILERAQPDHP